MMQALEKPQWIAVDWGTSNLRAWAIGPNGEILDHATSDQGMGGLQPTEFEPVLLETIAHWLRDDTPTTIIACGMVGARQGWIEAAYNTVPCPPTTLPLTRAPSHDPRIQVHIIPGLCQTDPADVMRGEETQVAGFIAQNSTYDGILCMPGTHCKWVQISAGEVVSFRTMMTGELYELLATQSVLRHSIGTDGWDDTAFAETVSDTLSRPESIAAKLFSLRANSLLSDQSPDTARSRLSGLLIGAELAATKPYWLGQNVTLIGTPHLTQVYSKALSLQGVTPQIADVTHLTLTGLSAAHSKLKALQ